MLRLPAAAASAADFEKSRWADVRPGDVVKVFNNERFPADLLLLRASDPPAQATAFGCSW